MLQRAGVSTLRTAVHAGLQPGFGASGACGIERGALRVVVAEPTLIRIFMVIGADQMFPAFAHPSAGGYFALRAEQTGAQVAERAGEQTRHVHLRNTELLGDL
jgi:hypothetical protein